MVPQLSAAVRVFLCTRPTDMRKSFDGLSGLVQECFKEDLLGGHLFLFLNRRRDRIKMLYFDRDGLAIWYKKCQQDCPHPFACTEIGGYPHNLIGWPAAAGGMD
jgi:transposase